jgi:pimeloyl-ACP methyl ester carboxylesterase
MTRSMRSWILLALVIVMSGAAVSVAATQPVRFTGTTCSTPPDQHCPGENCPGDVVTSGGPVVEPTTNRNYFLDYPCDLKRNEQVTFILSLHGGGSYGNWQRHYFPLLDNVSKHRLVVATPFSPKRVWGAEDDAYLQHIVSSVVDQIGARNIKAFWLVGHSQGGATSRRLVCTDFFKDRVDGFLSLSGGRIGGAPPRAANFGPPPSAGATGAAPRPPGNATGGLPARALAAPATPSCDFSHIYATGEHEIGALPATSTWAEKYGCAARTERAVVDSEKGYVFDRGRQNPGTKSWGLLPRPGTAKVFVYPKCQDGRVVADVVRIDKGHTEGLEPRITEELVRLMLSARGGKIQKSAKR